jgi:lysophospholipase L1-like esterase
LVAWSFLDDPFLGGEIGFGWTQAMILGAGLVLGLSSLLPRTLAGHVLTVFLACFVALLISELALRMVLGPKYYPPFELDDKYLYKLVPGASREYRHAPENGGGSVLYHVNSAGFRGPELRDRSPSVPRVVVYGDSFIQAEFSELADTFPAQLAEQLKQRLGVPVETINAGVAGYGPDQALLRMQDELSVLQPDVVVLAVYSGNDFGDLVRNKLFTIDEEGFKRIQPPPSIEPVMRRNMEISRYDSIIKKILKRASETALGYEKVAPTGAWAERLSRLEDEYREVVEGDRVVRALLTDDYTSDLAFLPESPQAKFKVALMRGVLAEAKQLTDSAGVALVVLIIPHPIDVTGGNHVTGSVDPEEFPLYDPTRLTRTVRAIADELNIPHVNLFDVFQRRGADALYLKGVDDHWNSTGQAVAADIVADYLVGICLLSAPSCAER